MIDKKIIIRHFCAHSFFFFSPLPPAHYCCAAEVEAAASTSAAPTQGAESALFSGSGLLEAVPHGMVALRLAALAAHLLPEGDNDAEE